MKNELLPCPFCGGKAEINHVDYIGDSYVNEWQIVCSGTFMAESKCFVMPETMIYPKKDDAIIAWNTRYDSTQTHK